MKKSLLVMLFLMLFVTGCFRTHISMDGRPYPSRLADHSQWAHHLFGGLVSLTDINAQKVCPNGVDFVYTKHSFVNMLLSYLTAAIYTPTVVKVWCKGSRTSFDVPIQSEKVKLAVEYLKNNPLLVQKLARQYQNQATRVAISSF